MFAGPLFVMRAWRQKSQWKAEQAEVLLYADEGHQRCRRSSCLSFVHFKRRVRVARPEGLQVGWDGAYFTGAIMPIRSTVGFCHLRSSSKLYRGNGNYRWWEG